jgi:hypothetical protein
MLFARRLPPEENAKRLTCGETTPAVPGVWSIAAMPPTDLYVHSLRAGRLGREVQEFELRPRQTAEILLVVSVRPAILRGKVLTADGRPAIGAPVYLNPLDPELRSRTGGVKTSRTDQNGEFILGGLPPGRYEALSSFAAVPDEGADWTPGQGKSVTLDENSEKKLELSLQELP